MEYSFIQPSQEKLNIPVTIAYGDGTGPEIMEAVLTILRYAAANIHIESVSINQTQYERGYISGIAPDAWPIIWQNHIILRAPAVRPPSNFFKSPDIALKKKLGLYVSVIPFRTYAPVLPTKYPDLDILLIKQNEEGPYAGIEYRPTYNITDTLASSSRHMTAKSLHYAFAYARHRQRKAISCVTHDTLLPLSEGIFRQQCETISQAYPEISVRYLSPEEIITQLLSAPEALDVIVTSHLHGDTLASLLADLTDTRYLTGRSNIGDYFCMFEPLHAADLERAGHYDANPSGLIQAAILMLDHIGQNDIATEIHNAWLKTIEEGFHTADMANATSTVETLTMMEFVSVLVNNILKKPSTLKPVYYTQPPPEKPDDLAMAELVSPKDTNASQIPSVKQLCGVDIFIEHITDNPEDLVQKLLVLTQKTFLKLQALACQNLQIWPDQGIAPIESDYWRGRFIPEGENKHAKIEHVLQLYQLLSKENITICSLKHLYLYDNEIGFSPILEE